LAGEQRLRDGLRAGRYDNLHGKVAQGKGAEVKKRGRGRRLVKRRKNAIF